MTDARRLIDISISIYPGMCQWVGEEIVSAEALSRTPADEANVTRLVLTSHSGTHVDSPRHFVHDAATVDAIPLDRWIGPCWVADLTGATPEVTAADLDAAAVPPGVERLILKTRNSALWRSAPDVFDDRFVGLSLDGAEWVVRRGIRLVGIDYLSIGPFHTTGIETHLTLLENDVLIVEGLDLGDAVAGAWELLCMPLKLRDGDGAPARVALRGPLEDDAIRGVP
ncbi:MAG TPA: cyclase family protein [Thermomicrobiales bacterium]|nr:cyclase family protein [Thermomicrobiales bacterium]